MPIGKCVFVLLMIATVVNSIQHHSCRVYSYCSPLAVCTSSGDTFRCVCIPGYAGDGYSCRVGESHESGVTVPVPICEAHSCWCPADYQLVEQECIRDGSKDTQKVKSTKIQITCETTLSTIDKCQFRVSRGEAASWHQLIDLSDSSQEATSRVPRQFRAKYIGAGLKHGRCGVELHNVPLGKYTVQCRVRDQETDWQDGAFTVTKDATSTMMVSISKHPTSSTKPFTISDTGFDHSDTTSLPTMTSETVDHQATHESGSAVSTLKIRAKSNDIRNNPRTSRIVCRTIPAVNLTTCQYHIQYNNNSHHLNTTHTWSYQQSTETQNGPKTDINSRDFLYIASYDIEGLKRGNCSIQMKKLTNGNYKIRCNIHTVDNVSLHEDLTLDVAVNGTGSRENPTSAADKKVSNAGTIAAVVVIFLLGFVAGIILVYAFNKKRWCFAATAANVDDAYTEYYEVEEEEEYPKMVAPFPIPGRIQSMDHRLKDAACTASKTSNDPVYVNIKIPTFIPPLEDDNCFVLDTLECDKRAAERNQVQISHTSL